MFQHVGHWVVLEHGAPSGPLPLYVCHLLSVQPYIFLQQVFNLPARAVGKVGHRVSLVEDSTGVLAVGGQVVRDDAGDLVVATDLQNLIQYVINRLPNLLVGDHTDVVEDADGLGELLNLDWIQMQRFVDLEALGLDLVQGFVGGQAREEVNGMVLVFLSVLLQILPRVGGFAGAGGSRDVENGTLLGGVGDVLELAVVGYLKLRNSLMRSSSSALLAN